MQEFKINMPLDMHLHLRDGEMLKKIVHYSSKNFAAALIMPNLVPAITSKEQVLNYKKTIKDLTKNDNFTPYMTLFFQDNYDRKFLENVKDEIIAIKLYPAGITTNSKQGISSFNIKTLSKTLNAMSELNIPLCVHGETNGFVLDREKEFMPIYELLAQSFPKLKIIMEHITTEEALKTLDKFPNLYASLTLHHIMIDLNDLLGDKLKTPLFCKPIAKLKSDKEALLQAALNAHPKIIFGSDSAPHPREEKEACACAAGIFSSPIALNALSTIFDKHNKLKNLQAFISDNAVKIYGLKKINKTVIMEKKNFKVKETYGGVLSFLEKEELAWSVKEIINA